MKMLGKRQGAAREMVKEPATGTGTLMVTRGDRPPADATAGKEHTGAAGCGAPEDELFECGL